MVMDNNIFGQTDVGKVRDNNEDAFLAEELLHSGFILGCVIDGVGGYEGGEVAAEIAKNCIKKNLFNVTAEDLIPRMVGTLKLANEEIFNRKKLDPSLEQMACVLTLVLADVARNKLYYAHVGDTRLYLLRDQALVKITTDHSFVGFLEDSGRLSESAAMSHPKRNEINQALGFASTADMKEDFIETGESPFLPGDMLLLCSDGLTDRIDKDQITSILNQHPGLPFAAGLLIDAANEAGGHDNITVVLVKNNTVPASYEASKPAAKKENAEPVEAALPPITPPSVVQPQKRNRGWIYLLIGLLVASLVVIGLLVQQVLYLQKTERQMAPIFENPWEPLPPRPQDTIKTPLRDSLSRTDSIATKTPTNGKRKAD
jgi:serine/threonine protein phosphatase PrpC